MIEVPISECSTYVDKCTVARSKYKLPRIAEGIYQYVIQGVYSINALGGKGKKLKEITVNRYIKKLINEGIIEEKINNRLIRYKLISKTYEKTYYPKKEKLEILNWIYNNKLYCESLKYIDRNNFSKEKYFRFYLFNKKKHRILRIYANVLDIYRTIRAKISVLGRQKSCVAKT